MKIISAIISSTAWRIISIIMKFAPLILVFSFFPWWLTALIYFTVIAIPIIGNVTDFIVWISAFIYSFFMPFDVGIAIYYVIFAVWIITTALPFILNLTGILISKITGK